MAPKFLVPKVTLSTAPKVEPKMIFNLLAGEILGPIPDLAKRCSTYKTSFKTFHDKYSEIAKFETGLLSVAGSGLVSYRRDLGHEQIIVQLEPSIYTVKWGEHEGDEEIELYSLAMPYRIIISDFENNHFVGSRHFFTLKPAYGWDLPLYATGFSNTNNIGYRNTSIGWICHYHDARGNNIKDLAGKIDYVVERESGLGEPYNYGNMSYTDGPTFYKKFMPDKPHFHNALNWHDHTEKHGMNWVFDESMYIRYYVSPANDGALGYCDPATHKNARPYTLKMAAFEHYLPYYDHTTPKPMNIVDQKVYNDKLRTTISAVLSNSGKKEDLASYEPSYTNDTKLPNVTNFSEDAKQKKNILEGKLCPGCNLPFPSEEQFCDVVTSMSGTNNTERNTDQWCKACSVNCAVVHYSSIYNDTKIYSNSVVYYDGFAKLHYFFWELIECPECATFYSPYYLQERGDPRIYGNNVLVNTGCLNCVDPEDYGIDQMSQKCVYWEFLTEKKILTFNATDIDGNPTLILDTCWVHVDTAELICACGIIPNPQEQIVNVEKNGELLKVCVSCKEIPLVSVSILPNEKEN